MRTGSSPKELLAAVTDGRRQDSAATTCWQVSDNRRNGSRRDDTRRNSRSVPRLSRDPRDNVDRAIGRRLVPSQRSVQLIPQPMGAIPGRGAFVTAQQPYAFNAYAIESGTLHVLQARR